MQSGRHPFSHSSCTVAPRRGGHKWFNISRGNLRPLIYAAVFLALASTSAQAVVYDYSSGAGTTHTAFKGNTSGAVPPTATNVPTNTFTTGDYSDVASSNNSRQSSSATGSTKALTRFVFTVSETPSTVIELAVQWEGFSQATGNVGLYIWNVSTSSYTLLSSTTNSSDTTLTGTATPPSQFIDGSNKVVVLVANAVNNKDINTNYVKITVKQCNAASDCNDNNVCTTDTCSATNLCSYANNTNSCNDSNGCTQTDTCSNGTCVGSNPVTCVASDQCHNAGTCNPQTGLCSNPTKPDLTACNDGNACTQTDRCQNGVCTGTNSVECPASDQCHRAGTCSPATGLCSNPPKENGSSCNDGNACTRTDTCQGGICSGGDPIECTSSDQCHLAGTCNPETGTCSNPPKENGTECNDGNACTQADTCEEGVCTGNDAIECTPSDQCHDAGICDSQTGICSNPPKSDGAECNDGNSCTRADTCQGGICTGDDPIQCPPPSQCHVAGTCNPETGSCVDVPKENGASCDDGNACTRTDTCESGVCAGSDEVICLATDQCHVAGTCNPESGNCSNPPIENGTSCDDGNPCTTIDLCDAGTCTGGEPIECQPLSQCHDAGTCNPKTGACTNPEKANGSSCNDGNPCTRSDSCESGQCLGNDPVICPAPDQCHLDGTCNPETGTCVNPAKEDGAECSDDRFCTVGDHCSSGQCVGAPRDCGDFANQCNTASCNETEDTCQSEPVADLTPCNDGNNCVTGEVCRAGQCGGGAAVECPNTPCNVHSCDPTGTEGNCSTVSPLPDDSACDDELFCTANSCQGGACIVTGSTCTQACDETVDACVQCLTHEQCNDNVGCTDDRCVDFTCVYTPNDGNCPQDGNYCNGSETCHATEGCVSGGDPCPPGQFCNEETDTCGQCLIDDHCSDAVECTVDRCIAGGCEYTADDANCPDNGIYCDGLERCDASNGCVSTGNPCAKNEFCNDETDVCDECRTDEDCDDSNPCTVDHECVSGICRAGAPVNCTSHNDQCNTASCDPAAAPGNCDILTPIANGTSCDDELHCTVEDVCRDGDCVGVARDCSELTNDCNIGVCNEDKNACVARPVTDGAACDDGRYCTVADVCLAGDCAGGPFDCSALNNQCNTGVCDEKSQSCVASPANEGLACTDALPCTVSDVCTEGACRGQPKDCTKSNDQCNTGVCNPESGACEPEPVEAGTVCDDLLFCTVHDSCSNGECVGEDDPCDETDRPYCNEVTDACDECRTAEDCHDGVACTDDRCEIGDCSNTANDEHCLDDGVYCNGREFCAANGCESTGDPCESGYCNEETDTCDECLTDEHCDDNNPCTIGHACAEGACRLPTPVDCSDAAEDCHVASCDPKGEPGNCDLIADAENGTRCNDGLFCTIEDACFSGICGGFAMDCRDKKDECNVGRCTEEAQGCVAVPVEDGTACNDSNACTHDDACSAGVCAGQEPTDLHGWNEFLHCMSGPESDIAEGCHCYDFNDDGHVDLKDVAEFMNAFTGE